jgi:hypothetical protein
MSQKAGKPDGGHIIGALAHEWHVGGSKLYACGECSQMVWLSPASQRLMATGKWDACCLRCARASGTEFAGLAPGAIEEVLAWMDRN